jgi:PHS family inorganic phosphate transporter-like MFS transporter
MTRWNGSAAAGRAQVAGDRGPVRMMLTAGLGFFTDAYDLFIIGTVTTILIPIWHLTTSQLMWLNSTSLLAAVVGALVFGRLADRIGRRTAALLEALVLATAAVLSAFAMSFTFLLLMRVVLGIAVGGDYSTSSIIASEFSRQKTRGRLIASVFAMQGLGLLVGPLYAATLLATGVPHDTAWRVMLASGAAPALWVAYLRYAMPETPRFLAGVRLDAAAARAAAALGHADTDIEARRVTARLLQRPFLLRLVATAGSWFLMDIAFYGNGVSSGLILKALISSATELHTILISAGIFLVFALPGYWVAAWTIDHIGRRFMQAMGFIVMAAAYGSIFLIPAVTTAPILFLLIYGVSYFFVEFGPNTTTFVYPAEVFPVNVRATANGISAAAGKTGAFLGAFLFPLVLLDVGLPGLMGILAVASLIGAGMTITMLPEPKGLALEVASGELDPAG